MKGLAIFILALGLTFTVLAVYVFGKEKPKQEIKTVRAEISFKDIIDTLNTVSRKVDTIKYYINIDSYYVEEVNHSLMLLKPLHARCTSDTTFIIEYSFHIK